MSPEPATGSPQPLFRPLGRSPVSNLLAASQPRPSRTLKSR